MDFYPFPDLETKRLVLRQLTGNDAWEVYRLRINDRVMQYLDSPKMVSEEEALKLVNKINKKIEDGKAIIWGIAKKESPDELIGTIGYWEIVEKHSRAEVGYLLHPDQHAKGYMTEALNAVLSYGFENMKLHRVEAQTNPQNKASIALLRKNSFLQEALFVEHHYFNNRFIDTAIFALLKHRFRPLFH